MPLCRPTAASTKRDREGLGSGPSVRPAGNGPPSCSPRAAPGEVARELDVSRQSASRWHAAGAAALQSRGPTGRRPKIPHAALKGIEEALVEGALAHGFATDVWTLDRIAVVIQG